MAEQTNLIRELRQIKSIIEETAVSLRSQRDILKTRGMSLPPLVLSAIDSLSNGVDNLETDIVNEQTELGQLRSLTATSALINSTLNPSQVFDQAMDVVIHLTDAERGYIILVDPDTGELDYRVMRESGVIPHTTPQISLTILSEVLETGQPLLADNAYKDDRLQEGASIAQMSLRSVLCVPLKYKDSILGVVYVDNRLRSGVFTEREKNLLSAFANQASVAIENARLYESIQRSLAEIGEMKALMDNVFASIGSGIMTTDDAHRVTTFNKAAASILERQPDEVIGQRLVNVIPGVSTELDNYLAEVRRHRTRQMLEAELEVQRRGRIAVSMKLSPLRDAQGVALVMDDLTENRQREQLFSMMRRYLPPEMVDNIDTISQIDLGGERREVTCMFVDVRPVETFPADFRPQQIMEQLNIYLTKATDCIHNHKGVIDKYMGNEIMILFNSQLNPMADHAAWAVEAALSLREAFMELYHELGIAPEPHFYRVGVNTGVATLGNVGSLNRREFTAIGDTINLSKRLEENTTGGQIIISEDTAAQIDTTDIRLAELDPLQVKGRRQETRIYEVFRA